jgi:hypothetical protein
MSNDPVSVFKEYLSKVSKGEKSPQEVVNAVGTWVKESGDSLKGKIEIEVEAAVKRMGFAKKTDVDKLAAEVADLKKLFAAKKSGVKKGVKKPIKKMAKGKVK